ncbi:MAG: MotA/TolQ/ExbB proton channel family protein [Geminicoccaceae bacterium]
MDPTLPAAAPPEFSLVTLALTADPVVQGVMLVLLLASVVGWAVILDKIVRIAGLRRAVRRFERTLAAGGPLPRESDVAGLPAALLRAGLDEWEDAGAGESRAERRERIERAMRAAVAAGLQRLEPGLPFLATVSSSAPFIGLFGTVWGIMHSFTAIAAAQDTSLAVVAPGIAEALFATAIGLAAAIPAAIAYNRLGAELTQLGRRLGATVGIIGARLARQTPVRRSGGAAA